MCLSVCKCVSLVFFAFYLTKDCIDAIQLKTPSSDFSRHRVVTPTIHHARTKRELASTRSEQNGIHHPDLTLKLNVEGEEHLVDLRLKDDLISGDHTLSYQKNGKKVMRKPSVEELDICQYHGKIRGKPDSWAALSTCHGIRGVIYDGRRLKHIEPAHHDHTIQSPHYLYDHDDLIKHGNCGYSGGVTHNTTFDPLLMQQYKKEKDIAKSRISRHKRSSDDTTVRGPSNSNSFTRYVELLLVADNREYIANGENLQTIYHQLKDVASIINAVYAPLNIFVALVGVEVWTERDEIQLTENGDDTLTHFLQYRKHIIRTKPNDNAHLLTRQRFKDGVVGKALKGPICTLEFSGGVATNHSETIGLVATTIAHEMGHNFGMEHDTAEDCHCQDEKCIMSPSSTSVMPIHWSSCSMESLAIAFERGMDHCLRNKPTKLFDSPTCGNGFVEAGEQCDCGLLLDRTLHDACTECCDPDTCLLRSNATCATGECCDLKTCRPKSAGTLCRSANRFCDLPEYCTGHSEFCPDDVFKMDSTPCVGAADAYCVAGSCRSHTDQCRLLWGVTGRMSHNECYTNNRMATQHGNCGYRRLEQEFLKCAPKDVLCGLLQCRHLNEQLQYGMESVSKLAYRFINSNGTIEPCRVAMIDLGVDQVDPGMVPDGAKCGDDMMCLNQQCVPVALVREKISKEDTSVCPSDCSGHGICNSNGHCHCEPGFAPPLCDSPGFGGSVDSGPSRDPTAQKHFMVTMYIIFLGIIPTILLVLFFIYYSKHNVLSCLNKPKKTSQSPKKTSLQQRISRSASKFAASFQNTNHAQTNTQTLNVHTLSSPDDMSSSLLRDSERSPGTNGNPPNFFGNFKGFSLTPMDKNTPEEPKAEAKNAKITPVHHNNITIKPALRAAPPLPAIPSPSTSPSVKRNSPSVKRSNSSVQSKIKSLMTSEKTEELHAVPAHPRPVISSPILEASTCTAKELISPLQGSKTLRPTRTAPGLPATSPDLPKRPLSMHSPTNAPQKPLPEEPKKVKEGISLNRIASFLKQEKPKERQPVERSNSLPKNPNHQLRVKTIDKAALRNLQISNPILQKEIELPVSTVPVVSDSEDVDDQKSFVNRTQSMRGPVSQKPLIQSFGSMRQAPGVSRPISLGRPTAPPPPLPTSTTYQKTQVKPDYVDCIEEKQAPLAHIDEESGDNIYAIIEESPEKPKPHPPPIKTIPQEPPEGYNTPRPITTLNSGSTESMGLLGEIVTEIQNRNIDSIYSSATLLRKKEKEKENRDSTYMNTDYKVPESVYSNSGAKSVSSTTSSGYLHPSAVNVPNYVKEEAKTEEESPPSPIMKINSKIPTFARQVTPPGLKATSTFRNVPSSPKNIPKNPARPMTANSPDLVSSCAPEIKNSKPPDVINNNKNEPPKVAAKPIIKNDNSKPPKATIEKRNLKTTPSLRPVVSTSTNQKQNDKNPALNRVNSKVDSNVKSIADNLNRNKPKVVPKPTVPLQKTETNKVSANKVVSRPSNVASLQQKFENRKSIGKEPAVVKK